MKLENSGFSLEKISNKNEFLWKLKKGDSVISMLAFAKEKDFVKVHYISLRHPKKNVQENIAFKRKFGVSPGEYLMRKLAKKGELNIRYHLLVEKGPRLIEFLKRRGLVKVTSTASGLFEGTPASLKITKKAVSLAKAKKSLFH